MAPQGEGGEWAKKAEIITPRASLSASEVNGIIYAIGGIRNGEGFNGEALQTVEAYDPKTDKWTKKANMPTQRGGLSTSVANGIIYAIGGWSMVGFFPTVEAYDPKNNTWIKKSDMSTKRDWFGTSVIDGIIYAIGGWNGLILSVVEAYDPATDTWTEKTNMPTPRFSVSSCVVNGIVYVIGGESIAATILSTVEAYDPKTDKWTKKADLPKGRFGSACVVNNKIYAIAGGVDEDTINSIDEYDPVTDIWVRKPIKTTDRGYFSTCVVNGKIYAIGGGSMWNVALNENTVEEYTPEGWSFSISPQGKLPNTWGNIKSR